MGIDEPLSVSKPWPCFIEQKNPKIRTMFYRPTPSILFPRLGQRTNTNKFHLASQIIHARNTLKIPCPVAHPCPV